jgi:hypothetical protein
VHAVLTVSQILLFFTRLQVSSLMLYPEMRKISAQEEEEEMDFVEESSGTPGELVRSKSAGKLMTQIPLTILPCSSAVSLCASPHSIPFPYLC